MEAIGHPPDPPLKTLSMFSVYAHTALEGLLKGSTSVVTIDTDLSDLFLLANPSGQGDLKQQLVTAGAECSKTLQGKCKLGQE